MKSKYRLEAKFEKIVSLFEACAYEDGHLGCYYCPVYKDCLLFWDYFTEYDNLRTLSIREIKDVVKYLNEAKQGKHKLEGNWWQQFISDRYGNKTKLQP